MKSSDLRKQAESAQSSKLHKLGAQGSLSMARKGQSAAIANAKKYATGGYVGGGKVDGGSAKPSTSKPAKSKGKGGKGATVNIVIAGKGPDAAGGPPMPPDAGPPIPLPPGGPGGPPGGPPMPMRAKGGKVLKRGDGGKTVQDDSGTDEGQQRKYLRKKASSERSDAIVPSALAVGSGAVSMLPGQGAALRSFNVGSAAYNAARAAGAINRAKKADKEADSFEDKKSGGRVKKKC